MSRSARRYLRAQCAGLDPKQADLWLREFAPVVTVIVGRFLTSLRHVHSFEKEDMQSVAKVAVLEACLTFNVNAGGTLRTWVGNVVRWRVAAAIEEADDSMVAPSRLYSVDIQHEAVDHVESFRLEIEAEDQVDTRCALQSFVARRKDVLLEIAGFHEDHGVWPTLTQLSACLHKTTHDMRIHVDELVAYDLLRVDVVQRKTENGSRSTRLFALTESGVMHAMSDAPRAVRAASRLAAVHEDVLAAITEWYDITGEWPTRDEIVQMAEEYPLSVVRACVQQFMQMGVVALVPSADGRREMRVCILPRETPALAPVVALRAAL